MRHTDTMGDRGRGRGRGHAHGRDRGHAHGRGRGHAERHGHGHGRPAAGHGEACRAIVPVAAGGRALAHHGSGGPTYRASYDDGHGGRVTLEAEVIRRHLTFVAAVDCSASMQWTRADAAVNGLEAIVDMMEPSDRYGLFSFSDTVRNLHHAMRRDKIDTARDRTHLRANTKAGSRTALFDAIAYGIDELVDAHRRNQDEDAVFHHVVITDGMDNVSSTSFEAVKAMVANPGLPNYHLVVIAVEMPDKNIRQLRDLCSPRHAEFIDVKSVSQLESILNEHAETIKLTLTVEAGRHRTRTQIRTSAAGAPDALRQLEAASGGMASVIAGFSRMFALRD